MWQRLSRREQTLVIFLGMIIFIYFFWTYVLQYQLQQFKIVNTSLKAAAARLERSREAPESIENLKSTVQEAEERFLKVANQFDKQITDGAFLVDIGVEAMRLGVDILFFRPGEVLRKEHYVELPLEFKVRGDYTRVLGFISKLENLANASEIRRLEIRALPLAEDAEGSPLLADGRVEGTLVLVLYAAPTAENQLRLDALSRWAVGRPDIFSAKGLTAPYPGIGMPAVNTGLAGVTGVQPGVAP